MIASLPMYWRAGNAALWRGFWRHVQSALPDLPDLTEPGDIPAPWTDHWLRPDLALSATCSLPFRTALKGRVTYVGTLGHSVNDTSGHYHSLLIRRKGDSKADILAYNEPISHSGWAVTRAHPLTQSIETTLETGAHVASLAAVAEGRADLAMIDAITWRILETFDPNTAKVEVIGQSAASPAHALITALGRDPEPLRVALARACQTFRTDTPMAMGGPLSFHLLDEAAYHALPIPAAPKP